MRPILSPGLLTIQNASVVWVISKLSEKLSPLLLVFLGCSQVKLNHPHFPLCNLEKRCYTGFLFRDDQTLAIQGNSIFMAQMEISPERIYLIGLLLIYILKLKLTCSRVPQNTKDGSLGYIWAMEATHSLKSISSKPVLGAFPCSSWSPLPSQ